jgi:hypothetical protein
VAVDRDPRWSARPRGPDGGKDSPWKAGTANAGVGTTHVSLFHELELETNVSHALKESLQNINKRQQTF